MQLTAQCIVLKCDVKDCEQQHEMLAIAGGLNSAVGWLEVMPHGGDGNKTHFRKFICPKHAAQLNLGDFNTVAEIPLSQAQQDPRFQKPETLKFLAALDPSMLGKALLTGSGKAALEAATTQAAPALPAEREGWK